MRFSAQSVPFVSLLLLPLFVAYHGYGLLSTLLLLALWALLRQAVVLRDVKTRWADKRLVLEALPVSHYVEKVRWALDKLGVPYEEEQDIGIGGVFFLGRMVRATYRTDFSLASDTSLRMRLWNLDSYIKMEAKNIHSGNSWIINTQKSQLTSIVTLECRPKLRRTYKGKKFKSRMRL